VCTDPVLTVDSFGRDGKTGAGLDVVGSGGFVPILGTTPGLEPTGVGLGLLVKVGGILADVFVDSCEVSENFFQGVEVPFAGPIPGKTETGFAKASDGTDVGTIFGAGGVLRGGADGRRGGADWGKTSSR